MTVDIDVPPELVWPHDPTVDAKPFDPYWDPWPDYRLADRLTMKRLEPSARHLGWLRPFITRPDPPPLTRWERFLIRLHLRSVPPPPEPLVRFDQAHMAVQTVAWAGYCPVHGAVDMAGFWALQERLFSLLLDRLLMDTLRADAGTTLLSSSLSVREAHNVIVRRHVYPDLLVVHPLSLPPPVDCDYEWSDDLELGGFNGIGWPTHLSAPPTLYGLQVLPTPACRPGHAMLLNAARAMHLWRGDPLRSLSHVNGDAFLMGLSTGIREERAAWAVQQPEAVIEIGRCFAPLDGRSNDA